MSIARWWLRSSDNEKAYSHKSSMLYIAVFNSTEWSVMGVMSTTTKLCPAVII